MTRCIRLAFAISAALVLVAPAIARANTITGTWRLERSGHAGRTQLALSSGGNLNTIELNENISAQAPLSGSHFEIRPEAGTFEFTGTLRNGEGSGDFVFTPSEQFISGLSARGLHSEDDREIMSAAAIDLTVGYIDTIRGSGYPHLRFGTLLAFRALNVTPASIAQLRIVFGPLPADEIISTTALHVTAAYVNELREMGISPVTAERAVTFKALHIDKAYVTQLESMGFRNLPPDEIVSFKAMHVDAAYLRRLASHGLKNLTPQQVIQLKAAGL